ncbi:4927_t:CDS:10 [Entrophospora sp. SA101]|nr:921_t:CDS:10 [Entrophospora sp. SA101]CAJ0868371.1 4927_t:CDS:10 [Entrophospora sp. SA101]
MWHCMYKACPCVFPRKEYQTPFDNYYEDDDNVEFENLLADPDSIPARLSRSPFQRSNSQGYLRINSMVAPDEETSLPSGHFDTLLEDDEEDNIQTADAQFLPDEQINKISEQVKFNQFNQMTDEQLIAEEEEETRLQEEEYNKKRQAAKQAALAKDETEFDEQRSLAMMNDGIQKVDISSSLSFNIPTTQQSFDYDATIEDYSPSLDEDIEEKMNDISSYQEGSIVRVSLKNFVTYDSVEFNPGPNLNMIIGPNGTGKSTIVCAIALGLGWNTSLLGRAKDISDFIKHGQDRASIEIELKCKDDNVVVTRLLTKVDNKTLWKLNGEKTTLKNIQSTVESLNIQVDNLCELEQIISEATENKRNHSDLYSSKKRELQRLSDKIERLDNVIDEIRRELSSVKKREQLSLKLRDLNDNLDNNSYKQDDLNREISPIQGHIRSLHNKLERINDLKLRRAERIRSDRATTEAIEWLKNNRSSFKKHVYFPICMEIDVKDTRYADAIENAIGYNLSTFVCEDNEDYRTMTNELCDKRGLRVNIVCFSHTNVNDFQSPLSGEEMNLLGFDGFLIDQIKAPPSMLNALCQLSRLHSIPVALDEKNINHKRIESLRKITKYIIGTTLYTIIFSRYGRGLAQNCSVSIRKARILLDSIDSREKSDIQRTLESRQSDLLSKEGLLRQLKEQETTIKSEISKLKDSKNNLLEEKRKAQQIVSSHARARAKLDQKRDALQREIDLPETIKEQEISLKEKLCESARGKARVFDEYQSTLNETIEVFINRNKANLSLIQATTDLGNLGRQIQDRDDALRQATAKFNEVTRKLNEVKKEAAHYRQESNRLINKLDDATRNELQELTQNMTLEEIEDAITDEKAKANLHHTVDPRVVDMYDERQAKIDSLRSQLETRNSTLTALNNEIAEKRQRWEPRLYELVKKISDNFSEAFDKIGCAGEVRINANEDYDKWGIDILVKFRDNEKLQPLTGQRQSGGERSVSTIMYLMALQELAKTPFRVVDEINQGMDPKNERLVHHQMVQTACRPNTSQYFLITPKLLPDLNYHKFMKVLCIYNGEWQPETMNWKKYIKERRDSA